MFCDLDYYAGLEAKALFNLSFQSPHQKKQIFIEEKNLC